MQTDASKELLGQFYEDSVFGSSHEFQSCSGVDLVEQQDLKNDLQPLCHSIRWKIRGSWTHSVQLRVFECQILTCRQRPLPFAPIIVAHELKAFKRLQNLHNLQKQRLAR